MQNVLLVIHMIACVALVIAVLLQRSEGGALGMGGGGTGGIISGRGAASVLVRVTMGLAATFIVTSVLMTRLNAEAAKTPSDIQRELEQRNKQDPLAIGAKPAETTPVPATPAPAPVDPLNPITTPGVNLTPTPATPAPAPATTPAAPPATTTTTPAKPATPKPAPVTPAPAPAATTTTPPATAPATSPTTPAAPPQN